MNQPGISDMIIKTRRHNEASPLNNDIAVFK